MHNVVQVCAKNNILETMLNNLQEYHDFIETQNGLYRDFQLSGKVSALRELVNDENEKKFCSYEIYLADFEIHKGKLKPLYSTVGENGETFVYPSLSLFEDNFDYLKQRAENIVNPKFKAKYYNILWESEIKHVKFAKLAVDNYLSFLKKCECNEADNLESKGFADLFENAFSLSQHISYKRDEIIDYLVSILGKKKINYFQEHQLIKLVAVEGKKIKKEILKDFFDYVEDTITKKCVQDQEKNFVKLQIVLAQKLNISTTVYHEKLAYLYLNQAKTDEESFIVHEYYLKALSHFKDANNKEKIEEITVLIEKAKESLTFKKFEFEHTDEFLQKYFETLQNNTDKLVEVGSPNNIYEYIILHPTLFPKASDLANNYRPATLDLVSTTTFDINKNINRDLKSGINSYRLHIDNITLRHLWMIFSKGMKNEKISYKTLIDYLSSNTWYGENTPITNSDGVKEDFKWLELLSPGIFSFFAQSEIDLKLKKNHSQQYILSIDSVVIKFEGLLRELSRKIGAQTVEIKDNGTQERISFEKLLDNPKIVNLIPEDDIALFKFLFTSAGMNLRNNIAHCFYKPRNYSAGIMWLLLAAILKLGNYKTNIKI